jgi:hypothetical protein
MCREQQIGEAEAVARHLRMAVQQTADLGDTDPGIRDCLRDLFVIDRRLKRGATKRLKVIVAETCGISYQSVMFIN